MTGFKTSFGRTIEVVPGYRGLLGCIWTGRHFANGLSAWRILTGSRGMRSFSKPFVVSCLNFSFSAY